MAGVLPSSWSWPSIYTSSTCPPSSRVPAPCPTSPCLLQTLSYRLCPGWCSKRSQGKAPCSSCSSIPPGHVPVSQSYLCSWTGSGPGAGSCLISGTTGLLLTLLNYGPSPGSSSPGPTFTSSSVPPSPTGNLLLADQPPDSNLHLLVPGRQGSVT